MNKLLFTLLFVVCSSMVFSQKNNIDSLRQVLWRNEVDTIFKYYTANTADTLRGLTVDEWRNGVKEIYDRVNNCNTKREYLYVISAL